MSHFRQQNNHETSSRYEMLESSRIEGDILPEMFKDEYPNEYTDKLNISLAQYEQIQMRSTNANGEYGVFNDLRMS